MKKIEGKVRFVIFCITVATSILLGYLEGKGHAARA